MGVIALFSHPSTDLELCIINSQLKIIIYCRWNVDEKRKAIPFTTELRSTAERKAQECVLWFNVPQYESSHCIEGSNKLNKLFRCQCLLFNKSSRVLSKLVLTI